MQATVELGGRSYQIPTLPTRKSREWRARVQKELLGMLDSLQDLSALQLDDLTFNSVGELLGIARTLLATVSGVPDLIVDLVFQYSPALAEHREELEDAATDEEFAAAFVEVMKLAFPFSAILKAVEIVPAGRSTETSPSSPSPSGETGTKN